MPHSFLNEKRKYEPTHSPEPLRTKRVEDALMGRLMPPCDRVLHCRVAGVKHRNADGSERQEIVARVEDFDFLDLVRNPDDDFDANAIKVCRYADGREQLGHLPADVAAELAPEMDRGFTWRAIATKVAGYGVRGCALMLFKPRA